MISHKGFIVAFACSWLALATGCFQDTHDENGVDYERAGEAGYARVTFSVVRPNESVQLLPIAHHVYLDHVATVPGAGGLAHAHVPEDRGQLGYRISSSGRGAAAIEIVDLGKLTAEGTPTSLYLISCRAESTNGNIWTAFDSPNRGDDGSFVRIELVDFRHVLCGRGTIQ